jgi:hypothetical protein
MRLMLGVVDLYTYASGNIVWEPRLVYTTAVAMESGCGEDILLKKELAEVLWQTD